ncbi:MAG: diaminopimelate decarboxylase [Bacillota bacterium]
MDLRGTMRITSDGRLEIGGCACDRLAREFGTPLYIMDEEDIRARCREVASALSRAYPDTFVAYAGKAFSTLAMCKLVHQEGLGLDVVSGGELYTALQAGFPPERILFHGSNKSVEEVETGVRAGILRFVVDNLHELDLLEDVARRFRRRVHVQIRLTPGIEPHTHEYIRTGQLDSKFGLGIADGQAMVAVKRVLASEFLVLEGLHCHIGSQILAVEPFGMAAAVVMDFASQVRKTTGHSVREVNLGGGLGVRYRPGDERVPLARYASLISRVVREKCLAHGLEMPRLMVEPGRYIVGEAGTTLYTVGAIKEIPGIRKYVSVDGGLADNPRVALYHASYEAVAATRASAPPEELVSVAGRHCESGDMLIWDIRLPRLRPGDLLAVLTTGAYTYSMSSNYNRYPKPAVVFARAGAADVVVARETYQDVVARDRIPARFESSQDASASSCVGTA